MKTKSKPFRYYVGMAVAKAFGAMSVVMFVVGFGMDAEPTGNVMDTRPNATGSPADMMDRHDCWDSVAPADMVGVIPGHVIIRMEGTDAVVYGGPNAVRIAFEQVLNGANTEHEVFGFCR